MFGEDDDDDIGDRAFPAAGSHNWSSLLPDVTSAPSLTVFRNRLKTYLFSRSFPSCFRFLVLTPCTVHWF